MKNRIVGLDIARALCMLYIVGFWHMDEYVGLFLDFPFLELVTCGILGMFTFISGFFMGKFRIESRADVFRFYGRRLVKIYPLFLVVSILMYMASIVFDQAFFKSFPQLLLTLTGLTCFIGPMPMTLWYVSMLLVFYLITPAIIFLKGRWSRTMACGTMWFLLFLAVYLGEADKRLVLYFPAYAVGILLAENTFINKDGVSGKCLCLSGAVCIVAIGLCGMKGSDLVTMVFIYSFIPFLRNLSALVARLGLNRLWEWMSYASMAAYLIHRLYYGLMQKIMGGWIRPVPAYLFVLPSLIVLACFTQKIYDIILIRIEAFTGRGA